MYNVNNGFCFISFMSLADIIAYVQKKKKVVNSQCPATTAVKTSVSLQIQILQCILFKNALI